MFDVQTARTYCTTNSTSHHRLLLKILHFIQTQTTAVSLLQMRRVGDSHDAWMNTVLSVNQVSGHQSLKNIDYINAPNDISCSHWYQPFFMCLYTLKLDVRSPSTGRIVYTSLKLTVPWANICEKTSRNESLLLFPFLLFSFPSSYK